MRNWEQEAANGRFLVNISKQKKYFCSHLDTLFHLCYTVSG